LTISGETMSPKNLVMTLELPAKVFVSMQRLEFGEKLKIDGSVVSLGDTPWGATVADIVLDGDTRSFIGLSFECSDLVHWQAMLKAANKMDPRSIALLERKFGNPDEVESSWSEKRVEILWANYDSTQMESAQLICSQWDWCYKLNNKNEYESLYAISLSDIDEILSDHALSFPRILDRQSPAVEIL